jgi:hypothetical protein
MRARICPVKPSRAAALRRSRQYLSVRAKYLVCLPRPAYPSRTAVRRLSPPLFALVRRNLDLGIQAMIPATLHMPSPGPEIAADGQIVAQRNSGSP